MNDRAESKPKLPVFASSCNVEVTKAFMGSWRPILRSMFEFRRRQLNATVEELMARIVDDDTDHVDLLLEVFGFLPYTEPNDDERLKEKMWRRYRDLRKSLMGNQEVPQV